MATEAGVEPTDGGREAQGNSETREESRRIRVEMAFVMCVSDLDRLRMMMHALGAEVERIRFTTPHARTSAGRGRR